MGWIEREYKHTGIMHTHDGQGHRIPCNIPLVQQFLTDCTFIFKDRPKGYNPEPLMASKIEKTVNKGS